MNKQNLDSICDEIRRRICTGEIAGGSVIHENTLGKEFGLSRTPIRQVLHKLVIQHFIETKTGVGSVVVENDRFDLEKDMKTCQGLLSISNKETDIPLGVNDQVTLAGLIVLLNSLRENPSLSLYWDIAYQFNNLISFHIDHDLISDSYNLISFRIYRHVIYRNENRLDVLIDNLEKELVLANACKTSNELLTEKFESISRLKKIMMFESC
ncbi:GntR family transcriptional regulator [Vibrio sp. WJH972]